MTEETTCTACGREVRTVLTVNDHRRKVDPTPDPAGTVVRVVSHTPDGTRTVRARILPGTELPAQETAWTLHDLTCPESFHAKRRAYAAQPKCRGCATPMDPWLTENGYPMHICCLPPLDLRDGLREKKSA
jgi:hypothetical protein